ncbi:hypothetical protein RIU96_07530 [Corynebacterium sp. Z-1]|uniref:hypothetical protein n=1 Tax=Corynebacterium sp. Z-1 TaxID=3074378 RepID=UPI0028835684|nr:hypothetical protein [Corynebacterium sp. Z-1]WNI12088.1 hypothetical protein RIU96_07530 [Corynebacterium sp. Z-1]
MVVEGFEELLLLAADSLRLSLELFALFVSGSVMELELFLEARTHQVEDLWRHLDATVEFFHLSFEPFHWYGW